MLFILRKHRRLFALHFLFFFFLLLLFVLFLKKSRAMSKIDKLLVKDEMRRRGYERAKTISLENNIYNFPRRLVQITI